MNLTIKQQACNFHTMRHMERVRNNLNKFVSELLVRGEKHDQTKLDSPEVELFTEYTPKLAECEYGSEEYKEHLEGLKPALDHHYAKNRHHTEHFPEVHSDEADAIEEAIKDLDPETDSLIIKVLTEKVSELRAPVNGMNLIDLDEMFSDWEAASFRQQNGNLKKSIEFNKERYSLNPQLVNIFKNSITIFE